MSTKTIYIYFIAYNHNRGYGRCDVTRETPITSIQDIEAVEEAIRALHVARNSYLTGFSGISVDNFILLRTEEVPL